MNLSCAVCGETERLSGERDGDEIVVTCEQCGAQWQRDLTPRCSQCESDDVQAVPLAIVEKGRGTQLSVVGTRTIHLCSLCDAETLARYHRNRPNPLMPDELPTVSPSG
ncbi:MAG: hypothetical protein ABFS21_09605 [Actinomycetota bacterium]